MKLVTKPKPINNLLLRPMFGATMKRFIILRKYLEGRVSKIFLRNFMGFVSKDGTPLLKYTRMYLLQILLKYYFNNGNIKKYLFTISSIIVMNKSWQFSRRCLSEGILYPKRKIILHPTDDCPKNITNFVEFFLEKKINFDLLSPKTQAF